MKLHSQKKTKKNVQRFLSVALVLCLVFSEGSQQIAVAGNAVGGGECHQHDDGCYEKVLVCEMEEQIAGNDESIPICGLEETEGHRHTVDCFAERSEGHIHTESCYERRLVCEMEEHIAQEEVVDATADVEDAAMWDAMFEDVEWRDSWGGDLVTAARMQLGYRESARNYAVMENKSHKGYTRYGQFAGEPYADWDAAFVNFCLHYAGLAEYGIFPDELDAAKWQEAFLGMDVKNAEFLTEPQGYVPAAGDIVFFERIVEIKPMETEAPEETEKPAEPEAPAEETEDPAETEAPAGETEEPAEPEAPAEETEEPIEPEAPAEETGKPIEPEAPAEEAEKPIATEAPAEETQGPAEPESSAEETEKPAEPEVPAEETENPTEPEVPAGETEEPAAQAEAEGSGEPEAQSGTETSVENKEAETAEESAIVELSETAGGTKGQEAAEPLTERKTMMGIVSSYDAETNTITVIEGDYDDEVKENTYNLSNIEASGIKAYLMMAKLEKQVRINEIRTLCAKGEDYTVTVRFTLEALPEDVTLEVKEIEKGSKQYQDCYDQALEALETTEEPEFARYFDITFLVDGKEVEPQAPVNVVINCENLKDANTGVNAEDIKVVHIGAEETSVVEDASVDEQQVSFDSDQFSIYAIVIVLGEPGELIYEGEGFTIKVSYGADARLPKGTELTIRELEKGSDEYKEYFERSEKALNLESDEMSQEDITLEEQFAYLFGGGVVVEDARIYDIELSYEGKKIEPAAPVNVEIHYDEEEAPEALNARAAEDTEEAEDAENAENTENTKVVHFADDGTEIISDVEVETGEDGVTISYQQGSFSKTAIAMATDYGNGGWWYDKNKGITHNNDYFRMRFRYKNGIFEVGYPGNYHASGVKDNADWSWPGDSGYPFDAEAGRLDRGTTIEQILKALAVNGSSAYKSDCQGIDFMMYETYTVDNSNWEANGSRNGGLQETEVWTGENYWGAQGRWRDKSISINRVGDYGSMIHIQSKSSHPVHARRHVVINNMASSQTAVLIEDEALLMMEEDSHIIGGPNKADAVGTGVYLDKGGSVEFFDNSFVTNMNVAVEQKNGKTRLKTSPNPFGENNGRVGMNDGNTTGVALWPGQSIGKWTEALPAGMKPVPIYLRELDQWKSGDIVMDSGRWWYDEIYKSSKRHDEMYGAVIPSDLGAEAHDKFYFQNNASTTNVKMALEYYDGGKTYTNQTVTNEGGEKQIVAPSERYPVIRFTRGTVYNPKTNTWYSTLYDAVNGTNGMGPNQGRAIESNDELVFYGDTIEDREIVIPGNVTNLTIRTSRPNEMTNDDRSGNACTAQINAGIRIENGASVTFQNGDKGDLTLNDAQSKTIITNNGTLNLKNGVTISGGKYGVDQNGTFNLYNGVKFENNGTADVRLEGTDEKDNKYITLQTTTPATNVRVEIASKYNGRDVVVAGDEISGTNSISNTLDETYLAKFPLTNLNKSEDYTYVYNVSGGPNSVRVLELKEKGKALVKIKKIDRETSDPIADVEFTITSGTGTGQVNTTLTTDANGEASISVKAGDYTITETKRAPGYQEASVSYTFTVTEKAGEKFTIDDVNFVTTDNVNFTLIVTNSPKKENVKFVKTDDGGNPLAGAEFALYDVNPDDSANSSATPVVTGTSVEGSGIIWEAEELKVEKIYWLKETNTPAGYLSLPTTQITIKDDGSVVISDGRVTEQRESGGLLTITVKNIPIYELPGTGGRGIYWYSIGGTLLMMAGVLILYRNKKKRVRRCRRA